jgi:hypothetical protein
MICLATAATIAMITTCPAPQVQTTQSSRPLITAQASMRCGLPPLPPLGCRVGACVCDQMGQNCQWTFICD